MASKRVKKKHLKLERCCALCGKRINFLYDEYTVGATKKVVCGKCISAGKETISPARPSCKTRTSAVVSPARMIQQLDQRIIGQNEAKRAISVAMWKQQLRRNGVDFPNCGLLLFGPTGCGKTALVREAATIAGLPFLCFDATSLTETGYRGKDASDILKELVIRHGRDNAQYGVIFIDELDKLAAVKGNDNRAAYSRGTQHSLLKLLDGSDYTVGDTTINCNNLLFLFGGAFTGLRTSKEADANHHTIGFCREAATSDCTSELTNEDLIRWGMEPELMGRIGRIVALNPLNKDNLRQILCCSELSFYRKYQHAFARYESTLELDEEMLASLVDRAFSLGLGARGLNALVEEALEEELLKLSEEL